MLRPPSGSRLRPFPALILPGSFSLQSSGPRPRLALAQIAGPALSRLRLQAPPFAKPAVTCPAFQPRDSNSRKRCLGLESCRGSDVAPCFPQVLSGPGLGRGGWGGQAGPAAPGLDWTAGEALLVSRSRPQDSVSARWDTCSFPDRHHPGCLSTSAGHPVDSFQLCGIFTSLTSRYREASDLTQASPVSGAFGLCY